MPLQLVSPPSEEPVSLWEAKLHLRVDFDEDDMLIASLITAARQAAETLTGRQFTTARWKQVLDCFPGSSLMGVPAGQVFSLPGHAILLFKTPVQSVVSINYLDMGSALQVMPAATYTVRSGRSACRRLVRYRSPSMPGMAVPPRYQRESRAGSSCVSAAFMPTAKRLQF